MPLHGRLSLLPLSDDIRMVQRYVEFGELHLLRQYRLIGQLSTDELPTRQIAIYPRAKLQREKAPSAEADGRRLASSRTRRDRDQCITSGVAGRSHICLSCRRPKSDAGSHWSVQRNPRCSRLLWSAGECVPSSPVSRMPANSPGGGHPLRAEQERETRGSGDSQVAGASRHRSAARPPRGCSPLTQCVYDAYRNGKGRAVRSAKGITGDESFEILGRSRDACSERATR